MMSATSEATILPNAAPITTPTARSMTLPFIANSLNSDPRLIATPFAESKAGDYERRHLIMGSCAPKSENPASGGVFTQTIKFV